MFVKGVEIWVRTETLLCARIMKSYCYIRLEGHAYLHLYGLEQGHWNRAGNMTDMFRGTLKNRGINKVSETLPPIKRNQLLPPLCDHLAIT